MGNGNDNQASQNSQPSRPAMRMPGQRGPRGPQVVEKPKDLKRTMARLIRYFEYEKQMVAGLLTVVVILVVCSVYAPKLQSEAIDRITEGNFSALPAVRINMLAVYGIAALCT